MPEIIDKAFLQFFENAIKSAVKEGLETQFKIEVKNSSATPATDDFLNGVSLHSAHLVLTSPVLEISLEIYATSQYLKACLDNAFGTNFDEDDPIVIEGVGEFINIISGIVRKKVNQKYNLNLDLTCPLINNYVEISVLRNKIEQMKFFSFETNLGVFLFGMDFGHLSRQKLD